MKLSCIIVDDEVLAQNVLKKYIGQLPALQLNNCCNNALEAISYLHQNKVDLLFLDINMPEISGLDMLKTLLLPPKVILTTAYSEYALESYNYNVSDYLLKPIRFERFLKAVNRVMEEKFAKTPEIQTPEIKQTSILIKDGTTIEKILFVDLLMIEAYGNYLKIFLKNGQMLITRETMVEMEQKLPGNLFIRVHKSFIVGLADISKITNNQLFVQNKTVPLGNSYRSEVLKKLKTQ